MYAIYLIIGLSSLFMLFFMLFGIKGFLSRFCLLRRTC